MSNPNVVVAVNVNQAEADMMTRLLSAELNRLISKHDQIDHEARTTGVGRSEDLYEIEQYMAQVRCTMNRFAGAF